MAISDIPDDLRSIALRIAPVGSRVTCTPPPDGTDEDFLVLVPDHATGEWTEALGGYGFDRGGSHIPDEANILPPEHRFVSWKAGDVNLIVTTSEAFFQRFMAATAVAKRLNLLDKADRIALFQAVLYGCAPVERTPEPAIPETLDEPVF